MAERYICVLLLHLECNRSDSLNQIGNFRNQSCMPQGKEMCPPTMLILFVMCFVSMEV
jgi:hypothetical protein